MGKVHKIIKIFLSVVIVISSATIYSCKKEKEKAKYYIAVEKNIRTNFTGSFSGSFCDKNDAHIEAADRIGITPLKSTSQIEKHKQKLCKIGTSPYYKLDSLTHSHPYLVPQAKKLLDNIGRSFCDSLKSRGGGSYRIIVTSLFRVSDDIKRLKNRNGNAADNSAHAYGTTMDISYRRFDAADSEFVITEDEHRNLLAEVLYDFRKKKLCYVKYEVKQGCFHITVR
ncbi:MAG: DUF5715 family protein [Bacteroidales bacterium]